MKINTTRTLQQNRALHLYCSLLAEALNDAGYDFRQFINEAGGALEVPWNMDLVKTTLWKPVQKAMIGEESTAEAGTMDYNKVYEVLNKQVAELTGVSVEWPHQKK